MCVALVAVDATVKISNPTFDRLERIQDFFRLPGDTPNIQTRLGPDELITGIELPTLPPGARSMYLKVRDRTSYAYALTSAAVVLTQDAEGRIDHIRVALGGVGSVPWRSHEAEDVRLHRYYTAVPLLIPSDPASAPRLSEPARDRRGDCGRHEVSQVPTRSLRA